MKRCNIIMTLQDEIRAIRERRQTICVDSGGIAKLHRYRRRGPSREDNRNIVLCDITLWIVSGGKSTKPTDPTNAVIPKNHFLVAWTRDHTIDDLLTDDLAEAMTAKLTNNGMILEG